MADSSELKEFLRIASRLLNLRASWSLKMSRLSVDWVAGMGRGLGRLSLNFWINLMTSSEELLSVPA